MSFELFQGYALERPEVVAGSAVEPSDLSRLRTAANFLGPELDFDQIEEIIEHDPGLAMQVIDGGWRRDPGRRPAKSAGVRSSRGGCPPDPVACRTGSPCCSASDVGRRSTRQVHEHIDPRPSVRTAGDPGESFALASLGFAAGMLSAVDILLHVSPTRHARHWHCRTNSTRPRSVRIRRSVDWYGMRSTSKWDGPIRTG